MTESELERHPGELRRRDLPEDPLKLFDRWYGQAAETEREPERMALATVDEQGRPDARMVLLKGYDERGLRFFTNYEGAKASHLARRPDVAIVLHWEVTDRQVRLRGEIEKLPAEESDAYFASRDRLSQLGAWASRQSRPLADRAEIEQALAEVATRFGGLSGGDPIPRPPHWGGFLIRPREVEFWQGRPGRLHDRFLYRRMEDGGWARPERLAP
jgi:pyridoxamine 5'-phosphate oxidase